MREDLIIVILELLLELRKELVFVGVVTALGDHPVVVLDIAQGDEPLGGSVLRGQL